MDGNQDAPTSKSMQPIYTQGTTAGKCWTVRRRPSSQKRKMEVGGKAPWKGAGGPRRTKVENSKKVRGHSWKGTSTGSGGGRGRAGLVRGLAPVISGPEGWVGSDHQRCQGQPSAWGDSVPQPCFPDDMGKYEACESIRKHPLFRCLLPSKSTSPKPRQEA